MPQLKSQLKSKLSPGDRLSNLRPSREATPLWVYLTIYYKAEHECYIDYMEGAKLLYSWLSSPEIPLDFQESKYPQIDDSSYRPMCILCEYTVQKLAEIISGETFGYYHSKAERAILIITYKKIIQDILNNAKKGQLDLL